MRISKNHNLLLAIALCFLFVISACAGIKVFEKDVDDSLSLKQALDESRTIRNEIANLKKHSELQYQESVSTIEAAYKKQIAIIKPELPSPLTEKDLFESDAEFNARRTTYEKNVESANKAIDAAIERMKDEKTYKLDLAKLEYLKQQVAVLKPFIKRLKTLQSRQFILPEEPVSIELDTPDANRNFFPTTITTKSKRWTVDWYYTDRDKAREIFKNRTFLKAEAIGQLDEGAISGYTMTAVRITSPGTGGYKILSVTQQPKDFSEIINYEASINGELAVAMNQPTQAVAYAKYEKPSNSLAGEFVFVPSGCFQMGSNRDNEKPEHEVCISDFFIGKYEITQQQWKAVMGNNPSKSDCKSDNCPVDSINYNETQEFISRLNNQINKTYRLPTEAEWEYACRYGGRDEMYCGGNELDVLAWYKDNADKRNHPVGQKQPNRLGIYDMSGNVLEWVQDWYDENYYYISPRSNPTGPPSGEKRISRGGNAHWSAEELRATGRGFLCDPKTRDVAIGFRLVFALP